MINNPGIRFWLVAVPMAQSLNLQSGTARNNRKSFTKFPSLTMSWQYLKCLWEAILKNIFRKVKTSFPYLKLPLDVRCLGIKSFQWFNFALRHLTFKGISRSSLRKISRRTAAKLFPSLPRLLLPFQFGSDFRISQFSKCPSFLPTFWSYFEQHILASTSSRDFFLMQVLGKV